MAKTPAMPWRDKVTNPHQIGGIETSVVDNGPARGLRIAWINTGTPLRYKVLIDRGLDIADAFYGQHSLAWLSHHGVCAARPDANAGLEWLYSFFGGLVCTCGLTHMGAPNDDDGETRGLHGRYSNLAAEVESIQQPDPAQGKLDFAITALIRESRVFGASLEMRRTIAGTLGEPALRIQDVVTNRGNAPAPHMLLYHCNFGWPLIDEGAQFIYQGACASFGRDMDDELFAGRHDYRRCSAPRESHRGGGESCGLIDVTPDTKGICRIGVANAKIGLALRMTYPKKQLPCVTNWQHWGPGEYVSALEPGTNPPYGQSEARKRKELIILKPGGSRRYDLTFDILAEAKAIDAFVRSAS